MPAPSRLAKHFASAVVMTSCLISTASLASGVNARIYGGEDADQADWPWMTGMNIFFTGTNPAFCGSQLISTDWVLTAAHCLVRESGALAEDMDFFYNAPDFGASDPIETERRSRDDIIIHPEYVPDRIALGHDIALVRVYNAPSLPMFPDLADGPTVDHLESLPAPRRDDIMTALGWGQTSPTSTGLALRMQQVMLDYIPRTPCNNFWGGLPTELLVCAGEPAPPPSATFGQDTCVGDSGGPLLVGTPAAPVIVGLTSFGSAQGCGLTNVPGVYTSTAAFAQWVEESTATPPAGITPAALIDGAILIDTYHSQPPGHPISDITFEVGNNSVVNPASLINLTLVDAPGASTLSVDGTTCPAGNCDLSASNPVAPGVWQPGAVSLDVAAPAADTTIAFALRLTSDEEDYRSSNNRPQVQIFVTDKPDLNLQAPTFVQGALVANQPQAWLNVSVENLSRHQNAENVVVELTLPPATDLVNAGTLGCTQNSAVMSCPLNTVAHGGSKDLALRLQSGDSIARTVSLAVVSGNDTFGAGTLEREVQVAYPQPEGLTLSGSSSSGSMWLFSLVALLLRYRPRSVRTPAA
ncbi:serine protease [Alcanivorax sp. JB21]|uniref:S1 family peptidase n=1 Tax=Alcanivorax limicola TaxID=2874102 RepID=UPI001CBDF756|nr:serine protease [Alcanivorax limicola]MBZ2189751.1 serine protease [Alcanivorax limicola]